MKRSEIERMLAVARSHQVVISMDPIDGLDGWVREVAIQRACVRVEVRQVGYDEGGVVFEASMQSLADAIELLETYLGTSLEVWNLVTPPSEHRLVDYASGEDVVDWIRNSGKGVPPMPPFRIVSAYWADLVEGG